MSEFHGIAIYEISEDRNQLKAKYTNAGLSKGNQYVIVNENVRKKIPDNKGVIGIYDARYIDNIPDPNIINECTLEIKRYNNDTEPVYIFMWRDKDNNPIWEGMGLGINDSHIAVSYIDA